MNKKTGFFLLVVIIGYIYLIYNPIMIGKHKDFESNSRYFSLKNNTIKLLDNENFTNGDFKAIFIVKERVEISKEIPFGHYFTTSNKKLIQEISNLEFKYTGADMTTVENEIIIYKNDKIIFKSGIVVDSKKEGLQNPDFGWIVTDNGGLTRILKKFDRNFSPVIVIE